MKCKHLLILVLSLLTLGVGAQPLYWTESLYNEALTSTIEKENTAMTEGNYSLKYTYTDDGTPYFLCDTFDVTGDADFSLSVDYLDNDPAGRISMRIWFYEEGNDSYLDRITSDATVDSENWQTITLTGTVPATATFAYVAIRMSTDDGWAGSATFWADNMIYSEDGGVTNKIMNGGFEQWYVAPGSTVQNWEESLYNVDKLSTIEHESEWVSDGYSSVKYSYTDDGTPYFLSDNFDVTGDASYNLAVDYLDNDPAGKISVRIWFYEEGNDSYLDRITSAATVDSEDWQTIELSGTVPAAANYAYIAIRMQTDAAWEGSATFYADNAVYTENGGEENHIANGSFEDWVPPSADPEFVTYKFEGIDPVVVGLIDKDAKTVTATVPFATDLTSLVATYTVNEGTMVKIGETSQESGVTANDFTNPVVYSLSTEDGSTGIEWIVTLTKEAPSTAKDIVSFRFGELDPPVNATVSAADHTVSAEVPSGTAVDALVPTLVISEFATVSPESGTAVDFSSPVTYTVTAQDGSIQDWVVTVTVASAGKVTLFAEDFEGIGTIPEGWIIINNDGYTQAAGEERWQDSAWIVTTTSRLELAGTNVAMASSYCSDMPLDGRADDWLILPKVSILDNTTLSWQAMSTTSSGNYPDDYMVLIAPALDGVTPNIPYFESEANILVTIAPESWSANVGRPGDGLSSHSINLKEAITPSAADGWSNMDVWIAFVLITDRYTNPETGVPNSTAGGSNLAIDNILMVNESATGVNPVNQTSAKLKVYPNPAYGTVKVNLNVSVSTDTQIELVDLTGRTVLQETRFAVAGENTFSLDLSELRKGVYFVKTSVGGSGFVSKLILK